MISSHNNAFSLSDIQSVQTNDNCLYTDQIRVMYNDPREDAPHFYYCTEDQSSTDTHVCDLFVSADTSAFFIFFGVCVCACVFVRKKWLAVSASVPAAVK